MTSISILVGIVENHPLVQRGLVELLHELDGVKVVWVCETVPAMLNLLRDGAPQADLVVLDRSLPGGGPQNADAVAAVTKTGSRVLVVSRTETSVAVAQAIAAGASGYLGKNAPADEFGTAIMEILRGRVFVSSRLQYQEELTRLVKLTTRELEIVALLARGYSDAVVAATLHISVRTVRTHLDRIKEKIGVRRRGMIVRWAADNGYLNGDR